MSDTVKALTIWQPWATLIACGAKRFETRNWSTHYRGRLAIHAGQTWNADLIATCYEEPFRSALEETRYPNPSMLPRGKVLCICTIERIWRAEQLLGELSEEQIAFGDFSHGRYAWQLTVEERLEEPVPARGKPGLWDLDLSEPAPMDS